MVMIGLAVGIAVATTSMGCGSSSTEMPDGGPSDSGPVADVIETFTVEASLRTVLGGGPCAAVDSLIAAPREVDVGQSMKLTASGIDPGDQSSDVLLTWAATGSAGSLASVAGATNTFNCTGPGAETVTVTAAIVDGGAACPGKSLTVVLVCD
jgi:hypothetical protein